MERDTEIFDIIEQENIRQHKGIELIASENFVSDQVMQAMGSCLTNKSAEGYPGHRYYGGCEVVDKAEQVAIDRVCKLFGAEYANVQPHSGAQANMAVFMTCLNPGDKFLGLNLSHGGHLSHGSPVNFSGLMYEALEYNVRESDGLIDYEQMEEVARRDNPVKYAHIVTSTTHKTLRGPRGGLILMGKDFPNPWGKTTPKGEVKMMSALLNSAVFPGAQGGPLEHVIAAKAVAFGEALTPEFKEYGKQIRKNAKAMAEALNAKGYKLISGGTDNHCILIDLRTKFPELTGKVAEKVLVEADITANKNMVPFDSRSPFQTSGIRLGTAAITTRGVKEDKMADIVDMIDTVLSNVDKPEVIADVRARVNAMMAEYPIYAY